MRRIWELINRLYIQRFIYFIISVYYSLPIQLLIAQIRNHLSLVFFWVFLFLVLGQYFLKELGGPYLLLEPEYCNEFNFIAMFLLGVSFGIFSLAYQITSYILEGYRFMFIGLEERPFLKFSLNNSLLPSAFWISYGIYFVDFQRKNAALTEWDIVWLLCGLLVGGISVSIISYLYFTKTELNIFTLIEGTIGSELKIPKTILREARRTLATNVRVDYFLSYVNKIRPVPKNLRGDYRKIVQVINSNHNNALKVEITILLILIILGIFKENTYFQIPAGASFILLMAFVIMIVGAVSFWFRRLGPLTLLVGLTGFYFINRLEPFVGKNYAYGLEYEKKTPVNYELSTFKQLANRNQVIQDSLHTIQILNNWKEKLTQKYGTDYKPPLILLCVTGGGSRAATWTVNSMQALEKNLDNRFLEHLHLITGASGGMMGAAYFRELMFQKHQNPNQVNLFDTQHVDNAAKDILNPIIFNVISTLFLPAGSFKDGNRSYERDRGYSFEQGFMHNTNAFANRRLIDYAVAESTAAVPMIIMSPIALNDGRKLFVASQPVGYLCYPQKFNEAYQNEYSGVDFRKMFAQHNADSLKYTTAIRMNATFPTLLPFIELPTSPRIEVVDAGLIDNFGITVAIKYMFYFREWLSQNTSEVILIQIRDSKRETNIHSHYKPTLMGKITGVGGTYNSMAEGKDFLYDELLEYADGWYKGTFQTYELQYIPTSTFREASLSLHLTRREKDDIVAAIENPENQRVFQDLKKRMKIYARKSNEY